MPDFKPNDGRLYAPATERNREFILAVLERVLPNPGTVLEIASGTGEHASFFAPKLAPRRWWPSDISEPMLKSIAAWQQATNARYLLPPIELDVCHAPWPVEADEKRSIDAVVTINMIHIAPWKACDFLMAGAGRVLPEKGVLYLYGPFKRNGEHTAPSNAIFDGWLKEQNPDWGVRDLETVEETAKAHQLALQEVVEMPANNLSLVFHKQP
ncbi:DUF938 domain-containing protein [Leptolyngbyaceae cyanobacterium CCMR0082]|uniref:DUF938 domain-containing protein n=1 Tax=Adonisia turfae CCMR0082 TaxID=2304604 RepID=A0A6M0SDC5_9CYAN|nr:DUF938 domain-containing protein [Adonisia turfae]MDV3350234.1 DUF938 domain-containing protein [Leptothoe sp. LEGE 181152]NEZ66507.1 DUF938 domain-containing protein [Adonisia turfae CCMR0082]